MPRRKTSRTQQYVKFLRAEGVRVKDIRKELKVTPKRYREILSGTGKSPTTRQRRVVFNAARRTAYIKAQRYGFTAKEAQKLTGKPILLMSRARGMNQGVRRASKVSWQKAAKMIKATFEHTARLKKQKKSKFWEDFRKYISPKLKQRAAFSLEVKTDSVKVFRKKGGKRGRRKRKR